MPNRTSCCTQTLNSNTPLAYDGIINLYQWFSLRFCLILLINSGAYLFHCIFHIHFFGFFSFFLFFSFLFISLHHFWLNRTRTAQNWHYWMANTVKKPPDRYYRPRIEAPYTHELVMSNNSLFELEDHMIYISLFIFQKIFLLDS